MIHEIIDIDAVLPQKYPFRFVDEVVDADIEGGRIICEKYVSINESFFQGHFPGNPVMPGVLVLEAMAQASILLYVLLHPQREGEKNDYFLGKVESRFLKPVKPGDRLEIEVVKDKFIAAGGIVNAVARVDSEDAVRAVIGFGVKKYYE